MSQDNYVALIPARGGSKGLQKKNIRALAGKPLIVWSIEHALATPKISRVIVSTDDEEIAEVARSAGADVPFVRPVELAQDTSGTEPVMLHALNWLSHKGKEPLNLVLLQPTSPLRKSGAVIAAIEQFEADSADSLLSVCSNHHFFWKKAPNPSALYDFLNRPRRQDIKSEDRWYRETGSIYITRSEILRKYKNRLGGRITMFEMSEDESFEIDTKTDLIVMSALMSEVRI
jgi:CMP-N,N'-diacetyllegionaminic acid synthase